MTDLMIAGNRSDSAIGFAHVHDLTVRDNTVTSFDEASEGAGAIPPAPASPLAASAWSAWIERVRANPGEIRWPCPLTDCKAILSSGAAVGDHLVEWHGWTEPEVSGFWRGEW